MLLHHCAGLADLRQVPTAVASPTAVVFTQGTSLQASPSVLRRAKKGRKRAAELALAKGPSVDHLAKSDSPMAGTVLGQVQTGPEAGVTPSAGSKRMADDIEGDDSLKVRLTACHCMLTL